MNDMFDLDQSMTILATQSEREALTSLSILQGVLNSLKPQTGLQDVRLRGELFGFIVGYRAALMRTNDT